MASLYKYRNLYYIAYKINGKRRIISTRLIYNAENKQKAEKAFKKFAKLEDSNKKKRKYGPKVEKKNENILDLKDASEMYFETINKGKSGKTDNHSRTFLVVFRRFSEVISLETDIKKINHEDIQKFVKKIRNEISNATVLTYLRYLKGFFNYLVEYEYIIKSPISKRVIPKSEIKDIKIFDSGSINLILDKANELNHNYYVIYKFLLLTGLRPCDIFELSAGQFNFETRNITVNISKTRRYINFPIYNELSEFITKELPEISELPKEQKIFSMYSVERIGKVFRKILKELKLEKESYNLKTFRKTFASVFAEKGIGEGDLADLLGHTSTNTTRIYYKRKNAAIIGKRLDAVNGLDFC